MQMLVFLFSLIARRANLDKQKYLRSAYSVSEPITWSLGSSTHLGNYVYSLLTADLLRTEFTLRWLLRVKTQHGMFPWLKYFINKSSQIIARDYIQKIRKSGLYLSFIGLFVGKCQWKWKWKVSESSDFNNCLFETLPRGRYLIK